MDPSGGVGGRPAGAGLAAWFARVVLIANVVALVVIAGRDPVPTSRPRPEASLTTTDPMPLTAHGLGPIRIGMAWSAAIDVGVVVTVPTPTCRVGAYAGAQVYGDREKVTGVAVREMSPGIGPVYVGTDEEVVRREFPSAVPFRPHGTPDNVTMLQVVDRDDALTLGIIDGKLAYGWATRADSPLIGC